MARARLALLFCLAGCGGSLSGSDAGREDGIDADSVASADASATRDGNADVGESEQPDARVPSVDAHASEPCTTRITYGSAWIHGPEHPAQFDDASGVITWDGVCTDEGSNSYALLSNGWRPYFSGRSACVIALDARGDCAPAPSECATRITYGARWLRPDGHASDHDDVGGVVTWDGQCERAGADSRASLSNGWVPHFAGASSCGISLRYVQCGGLFANPVIDVDCPDPGVTRDGDTFVLTCTSGGAAAAFPLRTSRDLVHWTSAGHAFPAGTRPSWASGDFWAPEIHHVGDRWIVYFSARRASDGRLVVGAGIAEDVLGPYTDVGAPLVTGPSPGVIDAHFFEASDGRRFLLYKVDGNAVGARTPILLHELEPDGVTLRGSATEILTNDRAWEDPLVEGPWMIERSGTFYLFYSASYYASARYATGVARSSSPTGPFTKSSGPILTSNGAWAGPGHGSVIVGPSGEWVHVYHAWIGDRVDASPGRLVLVDRLGWDADGWPTMHAAPGAISQPIP
ncbi:MAG: family 43 glycosylhydrolase [Deltaproteobacteria bacterium]|nr:family 43 glycosylhydrolase [Deltaproteobacteria bacterium]